MILPLHRRLGLILSLVVVGELREIRGCLCAHQLEIKERVADATRIVVLLDVVYDFVLGKLPASLDLTSI